MSISASKRCIPVFRHHLFVWITLFFIAWSSLPAVSMAQQPTATISAASGTVLVNGQQQTTGTVLSTGDVLETQAGASVMLELSDGSVLEIGENTRIDLAELSQSAPQARVSRLKLAWGWVRAKLAPGHQGQGAAFSIETPNALIGVKFSQPDVEVSYNPSSQETLGIAHTMELMARNLLTDEELLVPIGSSVIIVGTAVKVVAGILVVKGITEADIAGSAATITESTGTGSTGTTASQTTSSRMGTGAKVAIGVGATAAAAGGVVALVLSGEENSDSETAESSGDLSGNWVFSGSCTAYGCAPTITHPNPSCVGMGMCNCCSVRGTMPVIQNGNTLSGNTSSMSMTGTVDGTSVTFTFAPFSLVMPLVQVTDVFTGTLSGDTITGTLNGFGNVFASGLDVPMTWDGTFTVTINR